MKFIMPLISLIPFIGSCNNDKDATAETYVKFDFRI